VFGKVDAILEKLEENDATNEAFTSWKEIGIPDKMVNNALIHLFKQIIKLDAEEKRTICHQLVDQLFASELVTAVQVKESLARLVDRMEDSSTLPTAELAAWTVASEKLKLAEVAEMTEGGSTHPLFLAVLQALAAKDKSSAVEKFKSSGVNLTDQLPLALRTEEQLGAQLEERGLSFLAWVLKSVPEEDRKEAGFITSLVGAVVKHISEATTLAGEGCQDKEVVDKEKEMILAFKEVLQPFLTNSELQLTAVYSLQVFCFSRGFPKGLLLRWFVSLYEADIVEEQVFLKWKEDVNDSYPGKGKALFQVNNWLTWLEEAESEDDDEEED
jgi:translation initiation factor 4G